MYTPFIFLILTFLSIFIRRDKRIWGPLLILSLASAFYFGNITFLGIAAIALFFLLYMNYAIVTKPYLKIAFAVGILLISAALGVHQVSGFQNLLVKSSHCVSTDGIPCSLYFNFDKPFIGLAPLIFTIPLLRFSAQRIPPTLLGTLATLVLLLGTSLLFGVIHWDPKIPSIIIPWTVSNLFFVAVPEEAFFRGFIQRELSLRLGNISAIGITAFGFGLVHYLVIPNISYVILCILAGIGYGAVYAWTKSIVSAIFCHFTVNFVHILLFTYPLLSRY